MFAVVFFGLTACVLANSFEPTAAYWNQGLRPSLVNSNSLQDSGDQREPNPGYTSDYSAPPFFLNPFWLFFAPPWARQQLPPSYVSPASVDEREPILGQSCADGQACGGEDISRIPETSRLEGDIQVISKNTHTIAPETSRQEGDIHVISKDAHTIAPAVRLIGDVGVTSQDTSRITSVAPDTSSRKGDVQVPAQNKSRKRRHVGAGYRRMWGPRGMGGGMGAGMGSGFGGSGMGSGMGSGFGVGGMGSGMGAGMGSGAGGMGAGMGSGFGVGAMGSGMGAGMGSGFGGGGMGAGMGAGMGSGAGGMGAGMGSGFGGTGMGAGMGAGMGSGAGGMGFGMGAGMGASM